MPKSSTRSQLRWSPCGSRRSETSAFSSFGFTVDPSTAPAVAAVPTSWHPSNNNCMNNTPRKVSFEDGQRHHLALSGSSDHDTNTSSSIVVRSTLQEPGESNAGPYTRKSMVQGPRDPDIVASSASSGSLPRRSMSISSNSNNGNKNKKRPLMIRPITSLSLVDLAQGTEGEASSNNETNDEYEMEEQLRQAKRLCSPSSTASTPSLSLSQSTSFDLSSPSEEESNGGSSLPWGHFVDMVVSEDEDNRLLTTPLYYLTSPSLGPIFPKPGGTFHHNHNNHRQHHHHHHHPYNTHKGGSGSYFSSRYHRSTAALRIQRTGTPPRHLYLTRARLSSSSGSSSVASSSSGTSSTIDGENIRNGTEMPTKFRLLPRSTPSPPKDDATTTNKNNNNRNNDLVLPQSLIGAFSGLGLQVSAEKNQTNATAPSSTHLSR